jgi:hypothetical protein
MSPMRILLLTCCAALAACNAGSVSTPFGNPVADTLTYAQVQSLNPGVEAAWLLEEYPFGSVQRDEVGRVRVVTYAVTDPTGEGQTLVLYFDEREFLQNKSYSGRILRPPVDQP